ncbi:tripartite tricarboxylate transporter substrate binding protein [Arthrobacter sp. EH-1B-1]|uniref:Tripartite tricarboxylate transporter substrate binding protein n=1 Tax=Arthrobacter vasquezii TaxID=2977629 RepID=A0ABT6CU58_9MICC|nr:tripartite tricarboxylate transporter substrate binding protein [Arthrobacter vasquezii]MDF9277600.1 tripartite tricarboxylate transporter substrate binding protein [Arthrobacter vasquezii]
MMTRISKGAGIAAMAAAIALSSSACGGGNTAGSNESGGGSDYPSKPIQLIVSFDPGGGTDTGARILATHLEDELGVPVQVVNQPGAAGWVGWASLVKADPDGYTLGYINTPNLMTGYLNPELDRSNSLDDFWPIANHITDPGAIAVRADDDRFPDLDAFIKYAQENQVTTTSSGLASDDHIAALKINKENGTKLETVQGTGAAEGKAGVLGGHIDAYFANVGEVALEAESGDLRILGVMSEERSAFLPDVPTIEESGYGDIYNWSARGIAAPAGIPENVQEVLSEAFETAITKPEHQAEMDEQALFIDYKGHDEYVEMLKKEEEDLMDLLPLLGWQ